MNEGAFDSDPYAAFEPDGKFTLHSFDHSGLSASFGTESGSITQQSGSITRLDPLGNSYVFDVNGVQLIGE